MAGLTGIDRTEAAIGKIPFSPYPVLDLTEKIGQGNFDPKSSITGKTVKR